MGDYGDIVDQYTLHYELTVDNEYKFTSANIMYTGFGYSEENKVWMQNNSTLPVQLSNTDIDNSGVYYGSIAINKGYSLSEMNVVKLANIRFCNGYTEMNIASCPPSDMEVSYKFFRE